MDRGFEDSRRRFEELLERLDRHIEESNRRFEELVKQHNEIIERLKSPRS